MSGMMARSLEESRQFWVVERQSVPGFLAQVTTEMFEKTTVGSFALADIMRIKWKGNANELARLDEQLGTSGLDEICQIYKGKALYGQVYIYIYIFPYFGIVCYNPSVYVEDQACSSHGICSIYSYSFL